MPYLDVNDVRLHVQTLPRHGPADGTRHPKVVMIHGLILDNLASYYCTIANPVALLADTYLYDLRGNGRSEVPATGYTLADHVADLHGLLDAWGIDEPVHLVGNSFGGAIALAFAHRHPARVAGMFLVEAHFATEGWGEYMAGGLALAAFGLDRPDSKEWLEQHGTRKHNRLARRSEQLIYETSLIADLQREQPFSNRALEAITCPVSALYGSESDILDRAHTLSGHLPDCELHIVPGCEHGLLTEAPHVVRDHALAWLERFTSPPRRPEVVS